MKKNFPSLDGKADFFGELREIAELGVTVLDADFLFGVHFDIGEVGARCDTFFLHTVLRVRGTFF